MSLASSSSVAGVIAVASFLHNWTGLAPVGGPTGSAAAPFGSFSTRLSSHAEPESGATARRRAFTTARGGGGATTLATGDSVECAATVMVYSPFRSLLSPRGLGSAQSGPSVFVVIFPRQSGISPTQRPQLVREHFLAWKSWIRFMYGPILG